MFLLAAVDGTSINLHLQEILAAMQYIERQLQPLTLVVAFILLVFGTMRGFLEPEPRKFMLNLLRAIIIVCLVGHWFQIEQWLGYAADGLAQYRVDVNQRLLVRALSKSRLGKTWTKFGALLMRKSRRRAMAKINLTVGMGSTRCRQPKRYLMLMSPTFCRSCFGISTWELSLSANGSWS